MLWTAPPRHEGATAVGVVEAPTIRRSSPCRRSQQSVSTSPSRSFRFMALMSPAPGGPLDQTTLGKVCLKGQTRKHYLSIRKYLNVHELVADGIRAEGLEPDV